MTKKEFYKMPGKLKFGYILYKLLIFVFIIAMGVTAVFASGLSLPTIESQLSFSVGLVLIGIVTLLALSNRLRSLIKIKSVSFITMFLILLAFSYTINYLIYSVGLISIPLVVDDAILSPMWDNYVANTQDKE